MFQRARYMMSLHLPPHMRPPMGLQYIIMAMGADITKTHNRLAMPFYQRARTYMQSDEMRVSHPIVYAINKSLRITGRGPTLHHSRPCTSLESDIQLRSTTASFSTGIDKSWKGHQNRTDARTSCSRRMRCGCRSIILARPRMGRSRRNA